MHWKNLSKLDKGGEVCSRKTHSSLFSRNFLFTGDSFMLQGPSCFRYFVDCGKLFAGDVIEVETFGSKKEEKNGGSTALRSWYNLKPCFHCQCQRQKREKVALPLTLWMTNVINPVCCHANHRHLSNIDCLSFVECPLLAPLVIGFFSFFSCCGS